MIVDFQAHVFPPAYLDALCRLDSSVSLEEPDPASGMTYLFDRTLGRRINTVTFAGQDPEIRIAHMDELGVDVQVVSVPPPGADRFAPDAAMELARAANDAIGRWCHDYPGRFVGLCTLPTSSVPLALDELERCVEALEMRGFGCYSNLNGRPLDDEALLPLYERIARYGVPVYIHPTAPLATEATDLDIHPTLIFGWAFDATVAMTRLVYGRVTERFPEIPFIVADVGGVLAFFAQRAVNIYTGRTEEIRQRYGLRENPIDLFRRFYVDTADHPANTLRIARDFFGAEHLVFGTNYPYGPEDGRRFVRNSLEAVAALDLADDERACILGNTAARLLGIKQPA
ncbi:MAG TPA: amidohydrolase family protein [Chloroflexota bacterium]|nr:amidohydrolase family protein [Chloroflexota bacterium]